MFSLLWVLVALLIIFWILGLGGLFHIAASLLWIVLVVAIVIAILAFFFGRGTGGTTVV